MQTVLFKWRDELIRLRAEDILYILADGNYARAVLVSEKEQLLSMNLSKVHQMLENQLGIYANQFERVGRDLIIRKSCIYSIQTLKKKLVLKVPDSNRYFELEVSKEALKSLKLSQEANRPQAKLNIQLRDLQTRKVYPLHFGSNNFGRKSTSTLCDHSIDNGDSKMSRLHFNLIVTTAENSGNFEFNLIDLNSSNGTYHQNKRISIDVDCEVNVGDTIKAGNTEFILEYVDLEKTEIINIAPSP